MTIKDNDVAFSLCSFVSRQPTEKSFSQLLKKKVTGTLIKSNCGNIYRIQFHYNNLFTEPRFDYS